MSDMTIKQCAELWHIAPEVLMRQLQSTGMACTSLDDIVSDDQKQRLLEKFRTDMPTARTRDSVSRTTIRAPQSGARSVTVVTKKRVLPRPPVQPLPAEEKPPEVLPSALAEPLAPIAEPPNPSEQLPVVPAEELPTIEAAAVMPLPVKEESVKAAQAHESAAKPKETGRVRRPQDDKEEERRVASRRRSASGGREPSNVHHLSLMNKYRRTEDLLQSEDSESDARDRSAGRKRRKEVKEFYGEKTIKDNKHSFSKPTAPMVHVVSIPETITVGELASRLSMKVGDLMRALMRSGIMATVNQLLDQETAAIIVSDLGHEVQLDNRHDFEESIRIQYTAPPSTRAPVVTIMGHVDHGKTSLLDYIRRTSVAAGEAGGITQHIGAYHVETPRGMITFLDTPGHAAFSAMRARGAQCTDVVVLVVAADDGVMPQTKEAIQHAKAAQVPLIVAINKIDKDGSDVDRIRHELASAEVIPEEWGGDTQFVLLSAKTGQGVDLLLDSILVQAEVLQLQAVSEGLASGLVVEARLDKGRGVMATVLVQNGTLKVGDMILAGSEYGRVRALLDEQGRPLTEAGPSIPVVVLGLSGVPCAGDPFCIVPDERRAREVADFRHNKRRDLKLARQKTSQVDTMMDRMREGGSVRDLVLIIKADVQGSVEALCSALSVLSNAEVSVKIVAHGVGAITESDVHLAVASHGIIIGFNVRADASAKRLADQEGVSLNYYSVIYDAIDSLKQKLTGMLAPKFKDVIVGLAQVRDVFRSSKWGAIAGCMVQEGTIKRKLPIRVLRNSVVIFEGALESLRRFKEDVNEVRQGMECGIGVYQYNDVQPGDQIEVYEKVQVMPGHE